MPGLVPPYQNVTAIADSANALKAKGKWKYRNARARPAAAATESKAKCSGSRWSRNPFRFVCFSHRLNASQISMKDNYGMARNHLFVLVARFDDRSFSMTAVLRYF